ncbi:MAG TPA: hypothetical protein VEI45_05840 [Mycobacterium sp.]|uniref:hypothetical protein n=1 Tax=Mycobacterium sp. TaxID=1785 RepID=UPI002D254C05|nr:hypothetical protein [Mycobacterium sp.]HXY63876.1 hypothetical protein [Mycobacterium sp.]
MKNPAKKTTAMTETANTTPTMRRAQAAKWLTMFRRRGGLVELASVAESVGSSGDCSVWAEPSLLGMLSSFPVINDDKAYDVVSLRQDGHASRPIAARLNGFHGTTKARVG